MKWRASIEAARCLGIVRGSARPGLKGFSLPRRRLAPRALGLVALSALLTLGREASAQKSAIPQGGPFGAVATLDGGVHWFPTLPSFHLSAPAGDDGGAKLPGRGVEIGPGGQGAMSVYAGSAVTGVIADRWLLPLLSFEVGHVVGRSDRVLDGASGQVVELRPWTAWHAGITALGFGARWKHRRWMLEAQLLPGVAFMAAKGGVAEGASSSDLSAFAISPLLRVQIAGCRRLDPIERVCLFVAPSLYELGFLNGGVAGLRWEVGS